jgi:hypothetical protein
MASHPTTKLSARRPETPGRLQESLTNYPSSPTAQQDGDSLQRPGWASLFHRFLGTLATAVGPAMKPSSDMDM